MLDKVFAIISSIPALVPVRGEISSLAWKVIDDWGNRNHPAVQAAWASTLIGILAKLPESERQKALTAVLEIYPVKL